jgi:hypothetical protein
MSAAWASCVDGWQASEPRSIPGTTGVPACIASSLAREWWVKQYAEPVVVMGVAFLVVDTFPAIATYLLVAAVIGAGDVGAERRRLRRRAQNMHDAMLNQRIAMDEFERLRSGGQR